MHEEQVRTRYRPFESDFVAVQPLASTMREARPVPAGALTRAVLAWLAVVYAICYIAAPAALHLATGQAWGLLTFGILSLPAFFATALVTAVGAGVLRPTIRPPTLRRTEPILSAVVGSFLAWVLLQNSAEQLAPFARMSPLFLVGVTAINLVESSLIGTMLGTLTQSKVLAFGLGAGFQYMVLTLVLTTLAALS